MFVCSCCLFVTKAVAAVVGLCVGLLLLFVVVDAAIVVVAAVVVALFVCHDCCCCCCCLVVATIPMMQELPYHFDSRSATIL